MSIYSNILSISNDPQFFINIRNEILIEFVCFIFRRLRKRNLKKVCLVTYWGGDVTFVFQVSGGNLVPFSFDVFQFGHSSQTR